MRCGASIRIWAERPPRKSRHKVTKLPMYPWGWVLPYVTFAIEAGVGRIGRTPAIFGARRYCTGYQRALVAKRHPRGRLQDNSYISRVVSKVCLPALYIRYTTDEFCHAFLNPIAIGRLVRADRARCEPAGPCSVFAASARHLHRRFDYGWGANVQLSRGYATFAAWAGANPPS